MKSVYGDAHIDEIAVADLAGEYPAIQYVPPEGTFLLYRMKRDTVRPQDHADAARLQQLFGPLDD